MSTPKSRTVHPCVLSVWEGTPGGAEYSTYAHLSATVPTTGTTTTTTTTSTTTTTRMLPHLVTAQGSTLTIYIMDDETSKLLVQYKFTDLAGSVCYLGTLKSQHHDIPDALLIGFAGYPRMSIVTVTPHLLRAASLIDLTLAVQDASFGATATLEHDLQASLCQTVPGRATVAVILGGGVAVACLELTQHAHGWSSSEPYLLPLTTLNARELLTDTTTNSATISTGFGDILSSSFLLGYSEPTLVLLHSNPDHGGGQTWSGRLGRDEGGARNGLLVTAVTVTVAHARSAVLWSTEVPTDALHVYCATSCLVHCVNSLVAISNTGQIQQVMAVNGWVSTTLPYTLRSMVGPNPWPFPSLAISLDGAEFAFVNATTAFVILRGGQLYLLQYTNAWSLLPLYITIGALGQVAQVISWPLGSLASPALYPKWKEQQSKMDQDGPVEMGMLFAGSRLGDSSLLGYALAQSSVADAIKHEPGLATLPKKEDQEAKEKIIPAGDEEYERILQMEEDALYAPGGADDGPNVVPPSDDDNDDDRDTGLVVVSSARHKRARLSQLTVVQSLTVLDSITALGPLGPGCIGPLTQGQSQIQETTGKAPPALGATGYIYPCGYGSSGGVALLTVPGRDDRTILAEEDCINAKALFNLPSRGMVLISMSDRTRFLKVQQSPMGQSMVEVDVGQWTSKELETVLQMCELLAACERNDATFCLLVAIKTDDKNISYSLLVVNDEDSQLKLETNIPLPVLEGESIRSVAPLIQTEEGQIVLGYTLSTGQANVIHLDMDGGVQGFCFESQVPMDMDDGDGEVVVSPEEKFYRWGTIGAIDIFRAPKAFFPGFTRTVIEVPAGGDDDEETAAGVSSSADAANNDYDVEEEDRALYNELETSEPQPNPGATNTTLPTVNLEEERWFVAIARQSGMLEVYALDVLTQGAEPEPVWTSAGCSHGLSVLSPEQTDKTIRFPNRHKVQASEIRFFVIGPSKPKTAPFALGPNSLCLSIETSDGDVMLYKAELVPHTLGVALFRRVSLKDTTRPSKEQGKHFMKLRRKGIAKKVNDDAIGGFRHNELFRFKNLSRQDGLFAATSRPVWFIAERGYPTALAHRCRHVAPAGAKAKPVGGFCAGILKNDGDPGFMTLHERVGRVGSQRLTVFSGILDLTGSHGIIPGGGYFVEKLHMGVTVRKVQFIDNPAICGSRPLYAMLVSREYEEDSSALNDDGLTQEERDQSAEEKERAKIQRQVEADLGGFDVEQEWVEEVERDDSFRVESELGGAPPVPKTAYSLWIVDAANGWVVVDSHELEEFEHGLTMSVMHLSEFMAEPGSSIDTPEDDLETKMFIAVGTGFIGKDGEDVGSKGRVVLLELVKPSVTSSNVELNFVYEKKIFHGPVNSLSCLSWEGKNRIIIGAGADVNVEQWGNDKLTQVGFFRATMHILDIKLFKNFFVLSDAFDSLYFLVWRESDKSLTLLAKDYDPIPVYAAGLLSRGGSLDLVCHDDRQNLQFFQYAPGDPAARGGNKLVCRADYHLGSQTTDLQSHFCRNSLLVSSATPASTIAALQQQDAFFGRSDDDQRLGIHFGTTDGEYGAIIPLSEPIYWRLTALQSVMANALEGDCALSQRAWRLYRRSTRRGGCRTNDRKKGVIDGNLVIRYTDLPLAEQEDLASAIGSSVELILDNLLELRCSVMVI